MKEHFIIYEYLKELVTKSLKLLPAGNSVRDDHNLLLYNNCRFSLPGGQGVEVAHEIYIRSTDTTAGGARAWGRSWQKRPVRPF